ncbi:MAG: tetratricopeptide repeat protein [Phycisphaerae bacterium]|nr:tetratricopeptide repeat protein [Phycisphaerae bacterium]
MSTKRINKWAVLVLTLIVFGALMVTGLIIIRELSRRDPAHFVALADEAADHGQWRQAGDWYLRARKVSGDAVYLLPLGEMRLNEGSVAEAVGAWQEALVERPELVEAHRKLLDLRLGLADLYENLGDWREVARSAAALLDLGERLTDADRAFAENARGKALVKLAGDDPRNTELGLAALTGAVELAPKNVEYASDLAEAMIDAGQRDEGLALLKKRIERAGEGEDAARAELAYAQALATPPGDEETQDRARARRQEAVAAFRRALEEAGIDRELRAEILTGQGRFLVRQWSRSRRGNTGLGSAEELFPQAEKALQEAIAVAPEQYGAYVQLAQLYRASQRPADVVKTCDARLSLGLDRQGLEGARNRVATFSLLILASQASVDLAIDAITDNRPEDRQAWLARARDYVDRASGEFPNHPRAISQRGRILLTEGNDRAALADLREADQRYTAAGQMDWENKIILARLHLRLREPGAARDVLEDVMPMARAQGESGTMLLYARSLIESNDIDNPELTSVLSEVLLADPQNTEARSLQAALLERQGRVAQAMEVSGEGPQAVLLKAKDLALQGKPDEAIETLLEGTQTYPTNVQLLSVAASELLARNRGNEASALVKKALEAAPDDRTLQRLAVAVRQDLTDEQRRDAFVALLQEEPDAFLRAWGLGDVYARAGEKQKALEALRTAREHLLAKDTPSAQLATTAHLRALLFSEVRLAQEIGNDEAAKEAIKVAKETNADGAEGQTLLGLYYMLRSENDRAIVAFTEALRSQKTDVDALTNLGICYQRTGQTDRARDYFEQAVSVNPQAAIAHKALAALAKSAGDDEAFRRHLEMCARLMPGDPWVREELLLQQEDKNPKAAIAQREARLADKPDDIANIARLASLHESAGQIDEAAKYYDRLLSLRPEDRNVVIAAAKFYRRVNRPDRALEVSRAFVDRQTDPSERANAMVLVAAHHLGEGDATQAESVLLAAAETKRTFEVCRSLGDLYMRALDRPAEALKWLDRAVEIGRAEANPGLKDVLAVRIGCVLSGGENLEKAQEYVDQYRQSYPDDPRGMLWLAEVASRQGRAGEALTAISSFIEARPRDPYAHYLRASLYEMRGRAPAAIDDLEALKLIDPTAFGLAPRLRLADLYRQTGRETEWLGELESTASEPGDHPKVTEALIRAYLQVGRVADAERLVTAEINRAGTAASGSWYFLRSAVALRRGQIDRAISDARTAAERNNYAPASLVQAADVYLSSRRNAEGAEWLAAFAKRDGASAEVLSRWGRLLAGAGRNEDAVRALRMAMDRAVGESMDSVRVVTGDSMLAFGDAARAAEKFSSVPPSADLDRANDHLLSRLLHLAGRYEEADERLERLLAETTDDRRRGHLLAERGDLYQSADRWTDAVKAYEEALQYQPDNWIVLNNLAYVLSDRMGEHQRAVDYAEQAVRINPTADTLDTLGWARVQLGQFDSAIVTLRRALHFDAGQAVIHFHLGEALRRQARFLEARESLARAMDLAREDDDKAMQARIEESLARVDRSDSSS